MVYLLVEYLYIGRRAPLCVCAYAIHSYTGWHCVYEYACIRARAFILQKLAKVSG